MAETFEDPSKKRRLEDGTSAFAETTAESRKEKLETWLKPLDNEQLVKLLLDMYVLCFQPLPPVQTNDVSWGRRIHRFCFLAAHFGT